MSEKGTINRKVEMPRCDWIIICKLIEDEIMRGVCVTRAEQLLIILKDIRKQYEKEESP